MSIKSQTRIIGKFYDGKSIDKESLSGLLLDQISGKEAKLALQSGFFIANIKGGTAHDLPEEFLASLTNSRKDLAENYLLAATTTEGYGAIVYTHRALNLDPDISPGEQINIIQENGPYAARGEGFLASGVYKRDIHIKLRPEQQAYMEKLLGAARLERKMEGDISAEKHEQTYSEILEGTLADPFGPR